MGSKKERKLAENKNKYEACRIVKKWENFPFLSVTVALQYQLTVDHESARPLH